MGLYGKVRIVEVNRMTDNRDSVQYPHARAFGEALGKSLSVCNGAPSKGTFWTSRQSDIRYRATFSNGVRPYSIGEVQLTAPIHADFEITVYAPNLEAAEAFAEHYARDYVCALVSCALAQVEV
jgi:hypothetical protein